jgi:hypothetical protein
MCDASGGRLGSRVKWREAVPSKNSKLGGRVGGEALVILRSRMETLPLTGRLGPAKREGNELCP